MFAACTGFVFGLGLGARPDRRAAWPTPCWWSASRRCRASWTTPTATPACCSATAPARRCCGRARPARASCRWTCTATASWARCSRCRPAARAIRPATDTVAGARALHPHAGQEAVPVRGARDGGQPAPLRSRRGLVARRPRPGHPAPGQPAHHRGGARAARGCPRRRSCVNIDRYGNTSSASIPIALDEVVRAGRLKPGDQLGFVRVRRRRDLGRDGDALDPGRVAAAPRPPRRDRGHARAGRARRREARVPVPGPGRPDRRHGPGAGRARIPRRARCSRPPTACSGFALSEHLLERAGRGAARRRVHTQPALLTHSVAALRLLEAAGLAPAFVAGHSLGEYSACVAAGRARVRGRARGWCAARGELMYEAGLERPGTMAAILGLDRASRSRRRAPRRRTPASCVPANLNAPGQVVISGEVGRGRARLRDREARTGAKRAIRLEVSGAFHSPLMESAADGLARGARRASRSRDARCPVVAQRLGATPVQQRGRDPRRARGAAARRGALGGLDAPAARRRASRASSRSAPARCCAGCCARSTASAPSLERRGSRTACRRRCAALGRRLPAREGRDDRDAVRAGRPWTLRPRAGRAGRVRHRRRDRHRARDRARAGARAARRSRSSTATRSAPRRRSRRCAAPAATRTRLRRRHRRARTRSTRAFDAALEAARRASTSWSTTPGSPATACSCA